MARADQFLMGEVPLQNHTEFKSTPNSCLWGFEQKNKQHQNGLEFWSGARFRVQDFSPLKNAQFLS